MAAGERHGRVGDGGIRRTHSLRGSWHRAATGPIGDRTCQVENNTPVVGRDEVRRHREMHWLRIDRYYLERPSGVAVAHQPMTCHQCGHAPCETVCPVLATTRSSDGLNQQIYSRCVGTRYCMNNCPFKVRRFNWFDYAHDERMENLVLNPDVTVRSRGVAEKCTFCATGCTTAW